MITTVTVYVGKSHYLLSHSLDVSLYFNYNLQQQCNQFQHKPTAVTLTAHNLHLYAPPHKS